MYDSPPSVYKNSKGKYYHDDTNQPLSFYDSQMFESDFNFNNKFHLKQLKSKELILLSKNEINLGGAKDLKHKITMI